MMVKISPIGSSFRLSIGETAVGVYPQRESPTVRIALTTSAPGWLFSQTSFLFDRQRGLLFRFLSRETQIVHQFDDLLCVEVQE